jgi:uncharacterized protein
MNELIKRTEKYRKLTEKALGKVKIAVDETGSLHHIVVDFMEMASNYLKDGKYYEDKKEYETALASYAYAHAWLDSLARLGLVKTGKDYKLFTLYK